MTMDAPTFSIFLPTYNRAAILYRQLSALLSFLEGNPEIASRTEIIVSDNCSNDETAEVCDHFFKQYHEILNFTINRNSTNIGAVKNFFLAPYKCCGKFLWILGDDDILLGSNLRSIFKTLEEEDPDFAICATMQEALQETSSTTPEGLFQQLPITSLAHISRIFYRRSIWLSNEFDLNAVPGYYVWPLLLPLVHLEKNAKMLRIKEPIVYSTKDGGLEIWRGKTALARLAEFNIYIKKMAEKGADLNTMYKLNFTDGPFVAKKYLGACIFMTEESEALDSCDDLLEYFNIQGHPFVLLGNALRYPIFSPLIKAIREFSSRRKA